MRARLLLLVFVLAACGRSGMELPGDDAGGAHIPFPQFPDPNATTPGTTPTPTPTGSTLVDWVRVVAGQGEDAALALDHAIDVVGIAGTFRDTATFDTGVTSTAAGGGDGFIAVYDSAGQLSWRRPMGGAADDVARAIAMRGDGAVVTGGYFESSTIDFGNGSRSASGNRDLFTAVYGATGNPAWDVTAANGARDETFAVEWGTWVLFMGDFEDGGGDTDAFAYRRDESNGSGIGVIEHTQNGAGDHHRAVAFNPVSDRYVGVGYFTGTGSYESGGGAPTYTAAGEDAIAWHCLVGPNCITWGLRIGGPGNERATAVASMPANNWLIAGTFDGATASAGGTTLTNAGGTDLFVSRVSATGSFAWTKRFGGTGSETVTGVGIDDAGHVWVTGTYSGAFAAGSPLAPLTPRGLGSYLLELDTDGNPVAAREIGGEGVEVNALAVTPSGAIYLAGAFSNTTDLGKGPITSVGARDAFLLRTHQ